MKEGHKCPLKVALFLHDLRGGGVERVGVHLANGMRQMGHDVDMVLINREGNPAYFDAIDPTVKLLELPQSRTLTSVFGFRSYVKRHKPDVIVSALTHINVSTLLATSWMTQKPHTIVVEHNHKVGRYAKGEIERPALPIRMAFRLVPFVYKSADVIGAVSEGVKGALVAAANLSENAVSVLHNPVVTPKLMSAFEEEPDVPWLTDPGEPYVLGVGSFSREKDFSLLISAFARLRTKRPARLIILGEGPLRQELEAQAEATGFGGDIVLPGFVQNPFPLMRHANVFALSSRWEGLPTVLIEAMALGTSVVATDCPSGPSEILLRGCLGRLVPPGDVEALADALEQTMQTPQAPGPLKARAAYFAPEPAASRYLDTYYAARRSSRTLRATSDHVSA